MTETDEENPQIPGENDNTNENFTDIKSAETACPKPDSVENCSEGGEADDASEGGEVCSKSGGSESGELDSENDYYETESDSSGSDYSRKRKSRLFYLQMFYFLN